MESFKDSIASWASVLGAVLSLVGAIQSLTWLATVGGLMLVGSVCAIAYARWQHERIESAVLKVAGRSVDSLNMATLRRRLNETLIIQEAYNEATIDGEDLRVTWECAGFCRVDRETSIEFSVDSDNNIPFDELDCFAHDLKHDPERRHRIRPILVGPDGISKKVAIPFSRPLHRGEPFNVFLRYALPGCMKTGVDYYTASVSFAQDNLLQCSIRLVFLHDRPKWVRAYEVHSVGKVKLLKDLKPTIFDEESAEYVDSEPNFPPKSARIYVFSRARALQREHEEFADAASMRD